VTCAVYQPAGNRSKDFSLGATVLVSKENTAMIGSYGIVMIAA
jgi:hypothetical protein